MTSDQPDVLALRAAAGNEHAVPRTAVERNRAPDAPMDPAEELAGDADVFGLMDPLQAAGMAAALVIVLARKRRSPPPRKP